MEYPVKVETWTEDIEKEMGRKCTKEFIDVVQTFTDALNAAYEQGLEDGLQKAI